MLELPVEGESCVDQNELGAWPKGARGNFNVVINYYVALVSEGEVVLVLGDQKMEAFKRTKCRPSLEDPFLVHKKENLFGKKFFTTRTILGQGKKEHNIIIESSLSGPFDPEIWISVDGTCDEGNLAKHLEQRILDLQQSSTVNDGNMNVLQEQPSITEFCHFVYAWKTI
ncbi:hypothetical protein Leryth_012005 [Lithospermum erythrorhizon]|nr:hypothetical protein Leryth_012005 [Lithospermum erythrorhizon]